MTKAKLQPDEYTKEILIYPAWSERWSRMRTNKLSLVLSGLLLQHDL